MLAPIFTYDIQRTMQQRWFHLARVLFAAIVLVLFLWHLSQVTTFLARPDFRRSLPTFLGQTREFEHYLMVIYNITLFLIAPILAAGPILQEKRQKTLELLLTTQQRSANIILGHWVAAIAKLLILTSPVIPLLIWMHSFAGASPIHWMIVWLACTSLLAMPITAWPLLVAVYARQTFSALLWSYAGNALLVVALFTTFNDAQLSLWSHAVYEGAFWWYFTTIVAGPTLFCLIVAMWRLRPAFGAAPEREVRSARNRPTLEVSDQPILWKQTHCNHVLMPRVVRWLPRWARCVLFVASTIGIALFPDRAGGAWLLAVIVLSFPILAILRASTSIGSEREGGTWDSVRLTMISAEEIVTQTLPPIVSRLRVYWIILLPAIIVSSCRDYATLSVIPLWLMVGAVLYHAAVAGLHASIRMQSSWGSVLYAVATFAIYLAFFAVTSMVASVICSVMLMFCGCAILRNEHEAAVIATLGIVAIVACVVFLTSLHMMFRARSDFLLVQTKDYLVQLDRFEPWPPAETSPSVKM